MLIIRFNCLIKNILFNFINIAVGWSRTQTTNCNLRSIVTIKLYFNKFFFVRVI